MKRNVVWGNIVAMSLALPAIVYASDGIVCRLGQGRDAVRIEIRVGDPNPELDDDLHRATIVSHQHALDVCINYYHGRMGGPIR